MNNICASSGRVQQKGTYLTCKVVSIFIDVNVVISVLTLVVIVVIVVIVITCSCLVSIYSCAF